MRIVVSVSISMVLAALLLATSSGASAQGIPGVEPNKCLAGKNKCVSKKIAGLMKCRELCQKKPDKKCGEVQAACEQKVMDKFDGGDEPEEGCFEKLEGKANPEKAASLCTTTDDTAAVEAEVDAVVAELVARLEGTPAPTCGDGAINLASEQCDGADLGGASCVSLGHGGGELVCSPTCRFDVSACTTSCADLGMEEGITCQCFNLGRVCMRLPFSEPVCRLLFDGLSGSACVPVLGDPCCVADQSGEATPGPTCGDGVLQSRFEQCDGTDFGGASCVSLGGTGGELACTPTCAFDTSACTLF